MPACPSANDKCPLCVCVCVFQLPPTATMHFSCLVEVLFFSLRLIKLCRPVCCEEIAVFVAAAALQLYIKVTSVLH